MISIQGLACAITIKTLMEQGLVQGTVVLFGTPAEESTSGKINFVKENVVQSKVDCAMMLVILIHETQLVREDSLINNSIRLLMTACIPPGLHWIHLKLSISVRLLMQAWRLGMVSMH